VGDSPESAKDAKGRVKEAAGSLTGDSGLKQEGQIEQAEEKIKAGIDKVAEAAKGLVGKD